MLKVVIVEDEEIIRKGLVYTIDWLSMGCLIVGEACDGIQGLKLIQEQKPDLVITDIKMPVMNGLEMLESGLEFHQFYSVILTSYSDFEYAKQAISIKVFEYLLKPVDEEKLADIIDKIKNEADQHKAFDNLVKSGESIDLVDMDVYVLQNCKLNYYVNEALKQIKINYHKKISIESISNDLGVSSSYLSRKFREETSQTFLDILNKYRIQKAIELLNTGKFRVYEVSDMTGFGDYKHFCSVFRKYVNTSPTEFKKAKDFIILKNQGNDLL